MSDVIARQWSTERWSETLWEVYALRYADRPGRTRADSFIFDDDHASSHDMDYFIWALRSGGRTIIVDTGYDEAEAKRRGRPILRDPATHLAQFGIDPEHVTDVIITHLHYDHAGCLGAFPNARLHIQEAEMAFATGPCMCHPVLQMPFTADHVCEMVQRVYSGRVQFYDGTGQVAPGVTVHCTGGHSRGLQAVRVATRNGSLVLASDAAHYYENWMAKKPFPIVVDMQNMLDGFETIQSLASAPELVIPGHDPLVRKIFPAVDGAPDVFRLDADPVEKLSAD
ncbi:MAG: N-acyl homoserine lactonase family protein [Pseudomonadota bacterium]